MGRFKKGLLLGGLLGAGLVWLNTTKKGKQMKEQILDHAALVYSKAVKEIQDSKLLDEMTKSKYVAMVRQIVDKYAEQNELAANVKNLIVKLVSGQWKNLKAGAAKKKKE